jgi:hypothetical protein
VKEKDEIDKEVQEGGNDHGLVFVFEIGAGVPRIVVYVTVGT